MFSLPDRSFIGRIAFCMVWLFVFSLPSEKSIELPGIGTISRLAGALAMGSMLLAIVTEFRIRTPRGFHVLLASFVLWCALTMYWTASPDVTSMKLGSFVQLFLLVWLIWEACPNERDLHAMIAAYVLGTLVPFGDTVVRFLAGRQTYYQRFATTGFDPNDLALTMALSLPMAYYLSLKTDFAWRWLFRLQMVAACGTILLTASRGGSVAMTIGLSLVLTTAAVLSRKERLGLAVALVAAVPLVIALVPMSTWKRLATLKSEVTSGTLNSRKTLWQGGWDRFPEFPYRGGGLGAYPELLVPIAGRPRNFVPVAHNTFLSVLVETGIIGFSLYLGLLAVLIGFAFQMPWIEKRFWLTTLIVWAIGVSSLTWEHRKPTWLLFALIAAHASVTNRTASAGERSIDPHGPAVDIFVADRSAA